MQSEDKHHEATEREPTDTVVMADGVDEEPVEGNRRLFEGWLFWAVAALAVVYSSFHLYTLNIAPLETWTFRIIHVCGALVLGYVLYSGTQFVTDDGTVKARRWTTHWPGSCWHRRSTPFTRPE